MWLLYFSLFLTGLTPFAQCDYLDVEPDLDNPYAFHMFENVNLCHEVFHQEREFIQSLRDARHNLVEKIQSLRDLRNESIDSEIVSKAAAAAAIVSSGERTLTMLQRLNESTVGFPSPIDVEGAVNAMVLLFDTYSYNISATLEGVIQLPYYEESGREISFKTPSSSLSTADLSTFARYAYKKTWYDASIMFLRATFQAIPLQAKSERPSKAEFQELVKLRKNLVQLNNQWLLKKLTLADRDYKVLPYVVNDKLEKKKKQPKALQGVQLTYAKTSSAQGKEHFFRSVCNGFTFRKQVGLEYLGRCGYLHHFDPYLKLGPYPVEMASTDPFIMVIHKLFSENEMNYLVETSRPNLSRTRNKDLNNRGAKHEFKGGKRRRIVHKTVQHWLPDVEYAQLLTEPEELDTDWNYTLKSEVLFHLTRRLEIATGLALQGKYSATNYQTTNYGLAGLCETHIDPHGYLEGTELSVDRLGLKRSGDMMATIMGWIEDAPIGGATAFINPYQEVTVWPTKGSAAFWFNVDRKGFRDRRTVHGGCPVLHGSKWILNKWVYYFDQVDKYPCTLDPEEKFKPFAGLL